MVHQRPVHRPWLDDSQNGRGEYERRDSGYGRRRGLGTRNRTEVPRSTRKAIRVGHAGEWIDRASRWRIPPGNRDSGKGMAGPVDDAYHQRLGEGGADSILLPVPRNKAKGRRCPEAIANRVLTTCCQDQQRTKQTRRSGARQREAHEGGAVGSRSVIARAAVE